MNKVTRTELEWENAILSNNSEINGQIDLTYMLNIKNPHKGFNSP